MDESATLVILCGGSGERFGEDKLFYDFCGEPYVFHVFMSLREAWNGRTVVAVPSEKAERYVSLLERVGWESYAVVAGGETRGDSLRKAVKWVYTDWIFVHDGARFLLCGEIFEKLWKAKKGCSCVIPVEPVFHALRRGNEVVKREEFRITHTPQLFFKPHLMEVVGERCYDEAELLGRAGRKVCTVEDCCGCFKLTYRYQIPAFRRLLCGSESDTTGTP